eukprot:comp21736_c0_seq3/m.30753 comp21736_c0_seq3/g.30753  ORF comp21736_c0_seq3/g.30753 comp21736_c0_seq3/m.30753 type:complete len:252 (-) comp21736_c0_seq3:543-1298(-)
MLAKMAIDRGVTNKPADARDALTNSVTDVIKAAGTGGGGAQGLAAPPNLAHFPMLILGLLKHDAFKQAALPLDVRAMAHHHFKTFPVPTLTALTCARMYSLHNMAPQVGTTDEQGKVIMPPTMPLTAERLEPGGVFLIEDGTDMYVWVSKGVHPELCTLLFGAPYHGLPPFQPNQPPVHTLPVLDNDLSRRVQSILGHIREQYPHALMLTVVKEDDPRVRMLFLKHLILDRTDTMMSYVEFLQHAEKNFRK